MSSAWSRSMRRRAPVSEREEGQRVLGRRVEELEETVEGLLGEKRAAEAEEAALCAELNAERGAAESAARETMLMIERLQREKAAALLEARQFRRLAEGRSERDRQLHNALASLSALAGGYLALLHAHGIGPADENCYHEERRPVEHIEDGESGMNVMVVKKPVLPLPAEELEYTKDIGCGAATNAVAVEYTEEERVDGALDLYARVEGLEADRAATRREVAALRAEPARAVLAREMARRLCRESTAVTLVQKPHFSVVAICKWFFPVILRRKRCFTARSAQVALTIKNVLVSFSRSFLKMEPGRTFPESLRLTFGLSSALLGMLLLLERFTAALHRRRRSLLDS